MEAKIVVKNIEKSFGEIKVLDNISFNVLDKEFVSIVGPSGCGKTTLLYLTREFLDDYGGEINILGKNGFVFQDHNLFPWKTVKENIEVGPINKGKSKCEAEKITNDLLKEVNLGEFKDHYPPQISEGMKQRVGIARALANNPEILLMDEPFGSLDYLTRLKMQDFLLKLCKEKGLSVLFVTHDIDEAIKLSDKVIVLSKRPARILESIEINESNKVIVKKRIMELIGN
jgi:NitT/TauT family transport system ATP-binding protein